MCFFIERSQLTCIEISLLLPERLTRCVLLHWTCRHVNHGERMNSIDFGGHMSKVKVTMGIWLLTKCGVRGDSTLCVVIFSILIKVSVTWANEYDCAWWCGSTIYNVISLNLGRSLTPTSSLYSILWACHQNGFHHHRALSFWRGGNGYSMPGTG